MQDNFAIEVWPAEQRQITQSFGGNADIYSRFGLPGHSGIDFGGPEGSRIYAVTSGVVSHVGFDANGYGNHVRIQHPNGFETIYGHLQKAEVNQGDPVSAGTIIGLLGNTGFSTGPHLHFELRGPRLQSGWPNKIWDPTPYLLPHMGFARPSGPYAEGWVVEWAVS
ncbi:MAG: M23 family metallopeptidase, partial [Anaerolineales bacterium]|nr:M23 family metallopeptidase [Anaerolineales bacterium]